MMFSKNCGTPAKRGRKNETSRQAQAASGRSVRSPGGENKMSTFGYYPGPIDYWMFITDWRNGSVAILLAMGIFLVGYALARRSPTLMEPADALPAISGNNAINEVNPAASRQRIET
jgi:hypothetical protein